MAFSDTIQLAKNAGLDPHAFLERNDSYHFFQQLGDLIMTGPTGTNVADVVIGLTMDE
jgi:glycerate-2-kinase